jgi:hypothetical protein
VKVLDFGLAKTVESPAAVSGRSMSPTITSPAMTQGGRHSRHRHIHVARTSEKGALPTKRSDVWALGCVFYELLTGQRAFDGEDISETLASILRSEPDWKALPSETPAVVLSLLKRMLEKDRRTSRRRRRCCVIRPRRCAAARARQSHRLAGQQRHGSLVAAIAAIAMSAFALVRSGFDIAIDGEPKIVSRLTIPLKAEQQAVGLTLQLTDLVARRTQIGVCGRQSCLSSSAGSAGIEFRSVVRKSTRA